jgi:hypothetical protein
MLKVIIAASVALSVAACATPSRFEWGNYENSLYVYYKKPDARENYRKALIEAIERGEKSDRLAPGMYAELGFLFLEDGNNAEAISRFQKEMAAFPESRQFLGSIVSRISGGTVSSPPQAAKPAIPVVAQTAQ